MAGSRTEKMSVGVSDERRYSERLRRVIMFSLTSEGMPLSGIVRLAGGAYPADVRETLERMVTSGELVHEDDAYRLRSQWGQLVGERLLAHQETNSSPDEIPLQVSLADPHPADYDWRFTPSALGKLADHLRPFVDGGARIALLGTTTLFATLAGRGAEVTLLDKSPSLLKDLEAAGFKHGLVEQDLFDPIAENFGRYHIVVADPPWYPAFHRAFMLRGAEVLEEGGVLFLSVLPWLTRPSSITDRADILEFARECGLDLAEVRAGYLLYESPKFERIALAMNGIHCGDWRAGDLFVFRKVDEPSPMLEALRPEDEPTWEEYRIGNRKIKLRLRPNAKSSRFRINPASGTSRYFGSVSRRSPIRARIDLWSSDNLAYEVEGLDVLRYSLARLVAGDLVDSIVRDTAREFRLTSEEGSVLSNLLGEMSGKAVGWSQ